METGNRLANKPHLEILNGPEKGRKIHIVDNGAILGRAEGSDIVIRDPSLSRQHSRFFFRDHSLWVADMGSTNGTVVNDKEIKECPLLTGDALLLGEMQVTVLADGRKPSASVASTAPAIDLAPEPPTPEGPKVAIDLGLHPDDEENQTSSPQQKVRMERILLVVIIMTTLLIATALYNFSMKPDQTTKKTPASIEVPEDELRVLYEKVGADQNNIFRYVLDIADNNISVTIDSLNNGRHIERSQKLSKEAQRDLAKEIKQNDFFNLNAAYRGILQSNLLESRSLQIAIGTNAHRCEVINQIREPQRFKAIRELLEEFARNEMGLAALALPAEELLELAKKSFLNGSKLFEERLTDEGNLYKAIVAFNETEWFLETIEPKPEFYAQTLGKRADAQDMLNYRYKELSFNAERAIKIHDWPNAADNLSNICLLLPDREDERHDEARERLQDVQRRMNR